jgi:hypothetical protein
VTGLRPAVVALAGVLVVALAACGTAPAPVTIVPTVAPSVTVPESPVEGVVVAVESAGLNAVRGFTLRLADGALLHFTIGTLENGDTFPPGHLKEHSVSADPVRVFFRPEGGALLVYRIEDAG